LHPLDTVTGNPQPEQAIRPSGVSPLTVDVPVGDYLLVAVGDSEHGGSFHEVFRRVPSPDARNSVYKHLQWTVTAVGIIELPEIVLPQGDPSEDMVPFDGAERFMVGSAKRPEIPPHPRSVPGFFLDATEVSVSAVRSEAPDHIAFTWYARQQLEPADDEAIAFLSWDEAASYAERIGKRLPDEWEFEFAATLGGTRQYPWGDKAPELGDWARGQIGEPSWDRLPTDPPVYGLFSNVGEWTNSWPTVYPAARGWAVNLIERAAEERIVRGAAYSVVQGSLNPQDLATSDPRGRIAFSIKTWNRAIGLRCARSRKPRLQPEDFGRELSE
jgi:hypothetical protein